MLIRHTRVLSILSVLTIAIWMSKNTKKMVSFQKFTNGNFLTSFWQILHWNCNFPDVQVLTLTIGGATSCRSSWPCVKRLTSSSLLESSNNPVFCSMSSDILSLTDTRQLTLTVEIAVSWRRYWQQIEYVLNSQKFDQT